MNADAAPGFPFWKEPVGLIIGAAAGDHSDLVTELHQAQGDLGQVLAGSHYVGVEGLVEEEEAQWGTSTLAV